jgi:hypothetical protein
VCGAAVKEEEERCVMAEERSNERGLSHVREGSYQTKEGGGGGWIEEGRETGRGREEKGFY